MNIGAKSDGETLFLRFQSLMPGDQIISAGRNISQQKASGSIGKGEKRVIKYQDDRTHVGMDMTEDFYNAGPLECDRSNLVFRIAAQVKGSSTRKGKNIVKERVTVWEIDGCSNLDGKHMRYEGFVDLLNRRILFGKAPLACRFQVLKSPLQV